tara:strand:- start:2433 stop:4007 length:1575 start_codon:yes stop_codon:yes gene_type:complete
MINFKKSFLASILFFFSAIILFINFGCVKPDIPSQEDSLVYLMYDDVKDWDPASAFSLEILPMSNIYEPLLWYDASEEESRFIPALATSYKKSKDGLKWTFYLRDNVTFSDGHIFDANAVKISIERTKSIGEGAGFIWDPLDKIQIVDSLTIIFHLKYPTPLDLIVSAQYGAWIYSPKLAEMSRDSIRAGIAAGTGPYVLSKWIKNQSIILEENKTYWRGFSEKSFRKIDLRIVSEPATRIQMIQGGEADICSLIPIEALKSFDDNPNLEVKVFPSFVNHLLILNVNKPPTDDIKIRQAIASALDYQSIIENIYNGLANKPSGLIPSSIAGISAPKKQFKFDLKKGQELVEHSNFDKKKSIKLSYVASSNEYWKTCLMLQANCKKIGLNIDLHAGLWSEIWAKARKFKTSPNIIEMAWWPTYASPSDWLYNMFSSQEKPLFNLSYYSNAKIDSLIEVAKRLEGVNKKKSFEIYSQIQSTLIEDCVVIPIADLNAWIVTKKNLVGFKNNPAYATILFYSLERNSN